MDCEGDEQSKQQQDDLVNNFALASLPWDGCRMLKNLWVFSCFLLLGGCAVLPGVSPNGEPGPGGGQALEMNEPGPGGGQALEMNESLECKKALYSERPEPVREDKTFVFSKYFWQGEERLCFNVYESEIIDDRIEGQVEALFIGLEEEFGLGVPINLTLVDQANASAETLHQVNLDDCAIYNFLQENQLEDCAEGSDDWGNRSNAAGVGWDHIANGGNVALFSDFYEEAGHELSIKVFAHEFFHVHQFGTLYYFEEEDLFGIPKAWLEKPEETVWDDNPSRAHIMPNWLEEGGAEFAGPILAAQFDESISARGFFEESLDEARNVISTAASKGDEVSLQDYEFAGRLYESDQNPNNGVAREFAFQYTGGQWAHLYLWSLDDQNYEKLMVDFYAQWAETENVNPGRGWEVLFEELFAMPVEKFYRDFDAFMLEERAEQIKILPSDNEIRARELAR